MAKSDYAVKQSLTKKGYEVYNEVANRLQDGSEKSKLAENENAFIYARMAESWAKIRNEYGDTAYTAKDFMAEHAVNIGGELKEKGYAQPITNITVDLDKTIPVITVKEKYKGMDWKNLRNQKLPGDIEEKIVSTKNAKGEYIPYINKVSGRKIIITKRSVKHFKTDHTSNSESTKNRQTTWHYEMIEKIPEILQEGIWVEDHIDKHAKADGISLIYAMAEINDEPFVVKMTIKRQHNGFLLENGEYTKYKAYDISSKRKPLLGSTSGHSPFSKGGPDQPVPSSGFGITIRDLLREVKDWQGQPYINSDGTPNYGIYFGDYETGGVMFITPKENKTFNQRAWHGSGMDFNEFNLEKALTGAGDMVHGWGIYTAKNKKTARAYKKHAKSKGLPSYQYEVDIPFIDVRPCV